MEPKKTKSGKVPQDMNQIAFRVVQEATAEKVAKIPVKETGLKLGKKV